MYAVEMLNYGPVDVLVDTTMAPLPIIKAKQVLVKQHATAIDPYDVKFRQGLMGTDKPTPLIPGSSVAGEVVAIGDDVTAFAVGDRVAASTHLKSYAEFVAVGQSLLAKIPDEVSDKTAAAAVLGAQTGYQMIMKDLAVQPGESVLIHGGAGAVGLTALQIAKLREAGAIYTTAHGAGVKIIQTINPDIQVIDYQTTPLHNVLPEGVDVILDTIGGDTLRSSLDVLKPDGRLVSLVAAADDPRVTQSYMQSDGTQLAALLALIARGTVQIHIAETRAFNAENVKYFQTMRHAVGKLVLTFK